MATVPRPIDIGPMLPAIYAKWPELAELLKKLNDMLQRQRQAFAATTAVAGTTGSAASGSITFSTDGTITSTVTVDASGNATVDLDVAPEAITAAELGPAAVTTVKVADDNITYPKIQNVSAASRLLGRGSAAGAGDVEELTLSGGLSMSGTVLSSSTFTQKARTIAIMVDGGGAPPATGIIGFYEIPAAGTITGWTIAADVVGSAVVDVWKSTYAGFPPVVGGTIAGSEKPTLVAAQANQDASLSTWTTAVAAGDILAFNLDSVATVGKLWIWLRWTPS